MGLANSPSKFQPEVESTPVLEQVSIPSIPLNISVLPPHPPYSPSVIQPNPHLHPSVKQPGIQRSVISPRILVEEASLDWDNYSDSPSYNPSVQQLGNQANSLNITSCIREVQGISGLVGV